MEGETTKWETDKRSAQERELGKGVQLLRWQVWNACLAENHETHYWEIIFEACYFVHRNSASYAGATEFCLLVSRMFASSRSVDHVSSSLGHRRSPELSPCPRCSVYGQSRGMNGRGRAPDGKANALCVKARKRDTRWKRKWEQVDGWRSTSINGWTTPQERGKKV